MEAVGAITPTEVEAKLRSALMIVDGAARGKRTDMHQVLPPMAALLSLSWRLEGLLRSASARCSVSELNNLVNLGTKLHNGERQRELVRIVVRARLCNSTRRPFAPQLLRPSHPRRRLIPRPPPLPPTHPRAALRRSISWRPTLPRPEEQPV